MLSFRCLLKTSLKPSVTRRTFGIWHDKTVAAQKALDDAKNWEQGYTALKKLEEIPQRFDGGKFVPSKESILAILSHPIPTGDVSAALSLISAQMAQGSFTTDTQICNALLKISKASEDEQAIRDLATQIIRSGVKPDDETYAILTSDRDGAVVANLENVRANQKIISDEFMYTQLLGKWHTKWSERVMNLQNKY
eukprot:TRINITY_DN3347_c0_g1_i1.p1 TRINITY_DN3347_c0_g1~~TRINITY_DN3347_c0_g1_i1.p1  ORF type:complete len:195 (-),score=77.61 TRINITY_DN3347_c0_g1_i1:108-692(-)